MSNFNYIKTLTLLVCTRLFLCLHNPPNSDMDYMIFNMCMWYFCMFIHMGDPGYSLIQRTFVVCTEFDFGENQGQAQSLAHNDHPSIW